MASNEDNGHAPTYFTLTKHGKSVFTVELHMCSIPFLSAVLRYAVLG